MKAIPLHRALKRWLPLGAVLAAALAARAQTPAASPPPPAPPVETGSALQLLDFWVGEWEVVDATTRQLDGHDLVEKVLNGAAVIEHWQDADGHAGKSWFYYYRPEKRWKQIWVTDTGGVKEKVLVEQFSNGGVRFRGEIPLKDGHRLLDQTTLTPLPDGRVHQVIEQSPDAGATWRTVYDAYYTRTVKNR